jgi:hypothetical protein
MEIEEKEEEEFEDPMFIQEHSEKKELIEE